MYRNLGHIHETNESLQITEVTFLNEIMKQQKFAFFSTLVPKQIRAYHLMT